MELDGPEEEIKIKQDDIETDEIKPENGTNGLIDSVESLVADTKSDSDIKEVSDDRLIESKSEDKPKENFTPKIGIKPLQLLTEPKLADNVGKEDVKLKIDDLIIIPNNINHAEEGGSALQNLAKIASRYSALNKDKSRSQEFSSPSPKKPRTEDNKPGVAQPLPPTTAVKKPQLSSGVPAVSSADLSSTAATSLLQQFSLLSPGMFPGWPGAGPLSPSTPAQSSASPTSRSSSNPSSAGTGAASSAAAAAAASWLGSGLGLDPSKIGQDGYNLLKYYEQQLKALQSGSNPAPKANGLKEPSPSKKESKNKEKSKVSKLPPDTKRPPRLIQTPCPYSQTASIYGSPKSELQKARDSITKSNNNSSESGSKPETVILDLSSGSKEQQVLMQTPVRPVSVSTPASSISMRASPAVAPSSLVANVLNLSKPETKTPVTHVSDMSVDLSVKPSNPPSASITPRPEVKASPFSAEALLSKPNNNQAKPETSKSLPPLSMGIKGILEPDMRRNSPQPSPALPRASPSSNQSPGPRVTSPWHSPAQLSSSKPSHNQQRSTASSSSAAASLAALYSAGYLGGPPPSSSIPGLSTETTFSSLSSLSSSSLAPPTMPQGSNPYLSALMSPSLHGAAAAQAAAAAAAAKTPAAALAAGFPGLNPMDPSSQYYAALYQQQLSAYQHAASAAAMNPYGIRPGYPAPSSAGAAAAAELQALQQYKDMMTRAALGGAPTAAPGQAAAASNPYAALYGLMGYPGGFPGSRKDP